MAGMPQLMAVAMVKQLLTGGALAEAFIAVQNEIAYDPLQ
jgi:hypothetical protein